MIQGAPSGPTMTPCGADPAPRRVKRERPVLGSSQPSRPVCCAVYQTPPSRGGHVVGMRPRRDGELAHPQLALAGARGRREHERRHDCNEHDGA